MKEESGFCSYFARSSLLSSCANAIRALQKISSPITQSLTCQCAPAIEFHPGYKLSGSARRNCIFVPDGTVNDPTETPVRICRAVLGFASS